MVLVTSESCAGKMMADGRQSAHAVPETMQVGPSQGILPSSSPTVEWLRASRLGLKLVKAWGMLANLSQLPTRTHDLDRATERRNDEHLDRQEVLARGLPPLSSFALI
ncbi:hypothetical protein ABIB90_007158 [Bradyrhizobium sp. JR4.1]|uniref:hypothetical protein n=1 Tax=Bradyrhizobium sp. JR4.1 TaxID=3156372 RepID=UPI003393E182